MSGRARTQFFRFLPLLLFLTTLVTTTLSQRSIAFAATLMSILTAHEMGHYLVARHHRVPASLPHFIPIPPLPIFNLGTLGAVITMRTEQADRNQLLDIGAAGPIAGFLVAVPAMILGIRLSTPMAIAGQSQRVFLGESVLTKLLTLAFGPTLQPGYALAAHPVMLGAWAGFLVTSINLLTMGQLDGGHVLYAFSPTNAERWMHRVYRGLIALGLLGLLVQLPALLKSAGVDVHGLDHTTAPLVPWLTFSAVVWAMFGRFTGLRHPPVLDEGRPITPGRRRLAYACLLILGLSFMPNPLYALDSEPSTNGPQAVNRRPASSNPGARLPSKRTSFGSS